MTRQLDLEQLLDLWLEDGPTDAADAVFDAAVARVYRQRQRPSWRSSWRDPLVTTNFKLLIAAVAVIVVAIGGFALLSRPPTGPGNASPSPSASPTPSVAPSPTPLVYTWPIALTPGAYTTRLIWDIPFELGFTVPEGWQSRDVEVVNGGTLAVAFHLAGNTFRDPCGRVEIDPPTGSTVDDLANALAAMPAFDATGPTPVTTGGIADGRYLELSVRDDAGCETPGMWNDPPDAYNGAGPVGPPSWGAELANMRMWILDVDGVRLVVSALWSDTATPAELDELQAVVDSVRIVPTSGPPVALPSPG